jgi:peroxiredoxin
MRTCRLFSSIFAAVAAAALPSTAMPAVPHQEGAPVAPVAQRDRYDALEQEVEQETRVWNERYAAARSDIERHSLEAKYPPRVAVPRFLGLAEQNPGTEIARRALLVQVTETFADLTYPGGTLGKAAENDLFELHELAIGKLAPDIQGEDINAVSFKLSDYRGKVVVLFFWGNWCFPCQSIYPSLRLLTQRLADQPFALIGINSDPDRGALKKVIKAKGLAWRSFWDGGSGPIATRWNVKSWPTLYVLDQDGRIRFKNLYLDELDSALETLLKELPRRPR